MLEVKDLHVRLDTSSDVVKAVNGVSFEVEPGQTIGIVGESGSGKSVLAQSLMQLNPSPPAYYPKGEILYRGEDLLQASEQKMQWIRGNEIAMVFQDPLSSLNPVYTVGTQLIEAIRSHVHIKKKAAKKKAIQLLKDVGIPEPANRIKEYPHQFSGGMRQRVMIALALASNPKLLIADEPTTALDVTIQAEIMELLKELQVKYEMSLIIITHDLGVVANLADYILVMYAGKIVEKGPVNDIFYEAAMPYTWSLLQASPRMDDLDRNLVSIKGQPPNLTSLPKGCKFHPRCPFAEAKCLQQEPILDRRGEDHYAACILSSDDFKKKKQKIHHEKERVTEL